MDKIGLYKYLCSLPNVVQKDDWWCCTRCVLCGDSKKNPYKKRLYINCDPTKPDDPVWYKCFNCNACSILTKDMLNAIDAVNASTIYIFPNNKNIILAANQARDLTKDKEIIVIPTKTVPQGITAIINYVPEKTSQENTQAMMESLEHVKTGQVTYAVRDTHIDDKEIHEGDIMGIGDSGLLAIGDEVMAVTKEMIGRMVDEDSELISVYYGEDVTEEAAEQLGDELMKSYPDCDVEINYGGQPIYYCVVSVE